MVRKKKRVMEWASEAGSRRGPKPAIEMHPRRDEIVSELMEFVAAKKAGETRLGWERMISEWLEPNYGFSITPVCLKKYLNQYHGTQV